MLLLPLKIEGAISDGLKCLLGVENDLWPIENKQIRTSVLQCQALNSANSLNELGR